MSAFMVGKTHLDALLTAALAWRDARGPITWLAPGEDRDSDYAEGQPWRPTAGESYEARRREITPETVERVGAMLWAENQRSVNWRYAEDELEYIYTHTPLRWVGSINPWLILDALDCYEYQSCEHPGWKASEACAFVEALRRAAISRVRPEYVVWEITDPDIFLATATI